jgi:hypothetical protein
MEHTGRIKLTIVATQHIQLRAQQCCALLIAWDGLLSVILLNHHPGALLEHAADGDARLA